MSTISYSATKKKRQPLAKLALESIAPPELNTAIIAETSPPVKRGPGRPRFGVDAKDAIISFRVSKARRKAYESAAKATGISFAEWAADQLDRATIHGND